MCEIKTKSSLEPAFPCALLIYSNILRSLKEQNGHKEWLLGALKPRCLCKQSVLGETTIDPLDQRCSSQEGKLCLGNMQCAIYHTFLSLLCKTLICYCLKVSERNVLWFTAGLLRETSWYTGSIKIITLTHVIMEGLNSLSRLMWFNSTKNIIHFNINEKYLPTVYDPEEAMRTLLIEFSSNFLLQ